jgi:DNA repair exonuclease SbcCD ATPase subunit
MRLISATVRCYRLHKETTVEFDRSRTLIGGPNEAGKSTLAEAIHRALFLKAKGTTEYHKMMRSNCHAGNPEVELTFEACGDSYLLLKKFGGSGSAMLTKVGGETLTGDAAESRLTQLLGCAVEGGKSRDWADRQWAHLWVRQGEAGNAPTAIAGEHKDALFNRLQKGGGVAAMQSAKDARVAAKIAETVGVIFTNQGAPRAGTDLARAMEAEADATAALEMATCAVAKLGQAMQDVRTADDTLGTATAEIESTEQELVETEEALLAIANLRSEEQKQAQAVKEAAAAHSALVSGDLQIATLAKDIDSKSEALGKKEAELGTLDGRRRETSEISKQAEIEYQNAVEAARGARLERELAAQYEARFEKTRTHADLLEKRELVRTEASELEACLRRLAELPAVEGRHVKQLQKLAQDFGNANAALQAMAAGIEVVASDTVVTIEGTSIAAGEAKILTETADVVIGGTRLRIRPGGGTSLSDARTQAVDCHRFLAAALESAGVASAEAAAEVQAERAALQSQVKNHQGKLEALGADKLETEISAAEQASIAVEAQLHRKADLVTGFNAPATVQEAQALVRKLEKAEEILQGQEEAHKAALSRAREAAEQAAQTATEFQQSLQARRTELTGLQAQLALLVQTHGDETIRSGRLVSATTAMETVEKRLKAVQDEIAGLQPSVREADQARLKRAISVLKQNRDDAHIKRTVALTTLQSDGTLDPQEALSLAQAQLESAKTRCTQVQRHCQALKLLNDLFIEERTALAEHFTRPFSLKIGQYLERIFGNEAVARVTLDGNGAVRDMEVVRPQMGLGAHGFEVLSGGTKEQVAAAMRLAMAEVLAEGHDGCLPIVFDDSFAYSDPQRVKTLQRMLDLAAEKGLQVIVLTCTPLDYASLGAKLVMLG